MGRSEGVAGGVGVSVQNMSGKIDFVQLWSQRSQNLFFPSFEYFFWKKNFLIFWPLLDHFLVQQKFLITPFLAPGQFTTENRAIFGPNQQFFLRQKFDRKGVKNHQNIFGECSLGSKEHLKFWSFLDMSHICHHPTPPYPPPYRDRHKLKSYPREKVRWNLFQAFYEHKSTCVWKYIVWLL